jgi:peptidyl-prolyl cis-trans isomerase C
VADIERIEREYVADELLFRAAIDADVHRSSAAVRGELIAEMRRRAAGVPPDPTVEDLLDHYSDHLDRYHSEPTASFEQRFFVTEPQDAPSILARLRRDEPVTGDAFDQGLQFDRYGRSMLRGLFGEAFVAAVWAAPENEWFGPLPSVRGWHFVRVSARASRQLRPFAEVRDLVENDWIAAQIQGAVELELAELAAGRRIVIER